MLFPNGHIAKDAVGKSPVYLAEKSDVAAGKDTKIILVPVANNDNTRLIVQGIIGSEGSAELKKGKLRESGIIITESTTDVTELIEKILKIWYNEKIKKEIP